MIISLVLLLQNAMLAMQEFLYLFFSFIKLEKLITKLYNIY